MAIYGLPLIEDWIAFGPCPWQLFRSAKVFLRIQPVLFSHRRMAAFGSGRTMVSIVFATIASPSPYDTGNGLPSNVIYALTEDHGGTLWAGTRYGLAYFRNGRFHSLDPSAGAEDSRSITAGAADMDGAHVTVQRSGARIDSIAGI